jgi:hypothetical protein
MTDNIPWSIAGLSLAVGTVSAGICPALDGLAPGLELGSAGKAGWAGGGASKRRRAQRRGLDEAHDGGYVRSIDWDREQLMTGMDGECACAKIRSGQIGGWIMSTSQPKTGTAVRLKLD